MCVSCKCASLFQDPWSLRVVVVQESVYQSFKSKLAPRIRSMQVGDAFDKIADASACTFDNSIAQKLKQALSLDPSSEVRKFDVYCQYLSSVSLKPEDQTTPNISGLIAFKSSLQVIQPLSSSHSKWVPTVIFSAAPPTTSVLGTTDECPLLYVVGARSAKEAIGIANHCGAGAAASIWTESSAFAWEASLQLKV